ncbi:MAG: hypothetical protein KA314_03950 [Chloroflexi bacterium]|nr:hypothetical protein [Chloroflexota bacterium]MBP8054964.1 hypothetical protein [Chloroflexota bacterium]
MNTYTLEEKATKSSSYRRIEVHASDGAVDAFTARLPFGANVPLRPLNIQEPSFKDAGLALLSGYEETPTIEQNNKTVIDVGEQEADSFSLKVENLFSEHSEHKILPSKTLREYIRKLPTKKERQQIFAIMFVWAFNQQFNESISHEKLIAVMKYEDLFDSNTYKHIPEVAKNYFTTFDNNYRVNNYDGARRVEEIIKNIQNPEPSQVADSKKSSKGGKPVGKPNKLETETITPWLDMPLDVLQSFDVRKLESATEWGIFGLYILTKILRVQQTVKAGTLYAFLSRKYPTIGAKRKTLVDALRTNGTKVLLSADGAYSLTETGEREVKKLIESEGNK